VGEIAYVANVGDSRAIMSIDGGKKIVKLSEDHKPELKSERDRIEKHGGRVYQNTSFIPDPSPKNPSGQQTLIGPHRVLPGRLSVSRTIGDIEAKDIRYGGNTNVVSSKPEIRSFVIKDNYDFIVLGCDGVFEKLSNRKVMRHVWSTSSRRDQITTVHEKCGQSVDAVLNGCVNRKTLDNITAVIIGFNRYEEQTEKFNKFDQMYTKVPLTQLDWEHEGAEVSKVEQMSKQGVEVDILTKLMKPLDIVEEEMVEGSEIETTPASSAKHLSSGKHRHKPSMLS